SIRRIGRIRTTTPRSVSRNGRASAAATARPRLESVETRKRDSAQPERQRFIERPWGDRRDVGKKLWQVLVVATERQCVAPSGRLLGQSWPRKDQGQRNCGEHATV